MRTLLKGGSLAGTYLISKGNSRVIRKEISLTTEREYGYYRWYSQLKKLQRFETQFPNLFVKVLEYGVILPSTAYMDLEYHEDAVNCWTYVCECEDKEEVKRIFSQIVEKLDQLHKVKLNTCRNSISLYFKEEIESKIEECLATSLNFRKLYEETEVSLMLPELEVTAHRLYKNPVESYTHGNVTLENILYFPKTGEVIFIDPYEENVIDNKYNEYSQLLQSCNSNYELLCEGREDIPQGLKVFNSEMHRLLQTRLTQDEVKLVKFFECSQFYRMLPFKLKANNNADDTLPFLKVASNLTKEVLYG